MAQRSPRLSHHVIKAGERVRVLAGSWVSRVLVCDNLLNSSERFSASIPVFCLHSSF